MATAIGTKCIHEGWKPSQGEPRQLPVYQSTTFKYDTSDAMGKLFDLEADGYFYTRLQNPTNDAVAAKICALEGGVAAMLTSSGQAANFLKEQDKVAWVHYADLEGDEYYDLAKKYMPDGTCGVLAFGIKGGRSASIAFMDKLKLVSIVTHEPSCPSASASAGPGHPVTDRTA